jgi:hypothetical protein
MEPECRSSIIKDGTFAFASASAADSVVTALLRHPLVSKACLRDCANGSNVKKRRTELDVLSVEV